MEKSYVGLDLCFFCGEAKGVVLDRRLKNSLLHKAIYDQEPCDKCKGWMAQGIILISVDPVLSEDHKNPYRTGGWIVIKESAAEAMFNRESFEQVKKSRVAFVEDEAWDKAGFPRGEVMVDKEIKEEGGGEADGVREDVDRSDDAAG